MPWFSVPGHASDMWHVCEPRAPSAKSLSGPIEIHSSPEAVRIPRRMASWTCSWCSTLWMRMSSSPRSRSFWYAYRQSAPSMSWMDVMPRLSSSR